MWEQLGRTALTEEMKRDVVHEGFISRLRETWTARYWHYRTMKLDYLEVAFDNCRCPLLCHRLTNNEWVYRFFFGWKNGVPKKMVITGLTSTKEKNDVRDSLRRLAPEIEPNTELRLSHLFEIGNFDQEKDEIDDVHLTDLEEGFPEDDASDSSE